MLSVRKWTNSRQVAVGAAEPGTAPLGHHVRRRLTAIARRSSLERGLTRGLGWFSIVLGALEVFAPRGLAASLGLPPRRGLMRFFGFREIASGMGILLADRPAAGLWSRVAGDAMDLAALGAALRSTRADKMGAVKAIAAVTAVAALDLYMARRHSDPQRGPTTRLSQVAENVAARAS